MSEQPKFQAPPGKLKLTGRYTPPPVERPEGEPQPRQKEE